ncbi:unnamed protein product, partial [Effrenium voratum]
QRRERQKLDAAAELLPAGCVVHGYLGDSFLFSSSDGGFSAEATVRHLQSRGLFFTVKPMPANDSEYFEALQGIGMRHSRLTLAARQKVRLDATATVRNWLKDEEKGPTPHLDLAISVEHRVPVRWDHQQDHMEIYNATDGVWSTGKCDGDVAPRPILSSVGAMLSKLDNGDCMPPLDQERHHHFQIHFKGGDKLSFLAHPPPLQDFLDDDKALQRAMELPMARTVTADRNTRSVPRQFMEYQLRLARAILKGLVDIVEELEAASVGHAMWRSIFRDPHGGDWNVALFQARLIFESVVGKAAKKIEFATLKDNGDGSTGKGTLRELCEKALGVHNGGVERGYASS